MCTFVRRLLCALASMWAAIGGQIAFAADTVVALDQCPKRGPHQACLAIPVHWLDDVLGGKDGEPGLLVSGRFADAREEKFVLALSRQSPSREAPYGTVAYLGRSNRNRPVVLTTDGSFELSGGVQRSALPNNIFVVDTRPRWRVTDKYSEISSIHVAQDGTLWISENGACISAPRNKPGLLTAKGSACSAETHLRARLRVSAALNPDFERLIALLPELGDFRGGLIHENRLGAPDNGYDYIEVLSVNETSFLIVRIGCDCID